MNKRCVCPICGGSDVRPYRVIYKTGHAFGFETRREQVSEWIRTETRTKSDGSKETKEYRTPIYEDINYRSDTFSELGRSVAPPEPPTKPTAPVKPNHGFWGTICGLGTTVTGCGCFGAALIVIGGLLIEIMGIMKVKLPMGMRAFYVIIGLSIVWYFMNRNSENKNWIRQQQHYYEEMKAYEDQCKTYEENLAQWNRMMYCFYCDRGFLPDNDINDETVE